MLYTSDLNKLLSQWTERLGFQTAKQEYKDAVRDCIYDLRSLMDASFAEEALVNESFEQMLKNDSSNWNVYLSDKYERDGIVAS